jgi:hypothetical protein
MPTVAVSRAFSTTCRAAQQSGSKPKSVEHRYNYNTSLAWEKEPDPNVSLLPSVQKFSR